MGNETGTSHSMLMDGPAEGHKHLDLLDYLYHHYY